MNKNEVDIRICIASAIKEADKSYFFEDYLKQADNVLRELKASGYHILPSEVNDDMIAAGKVAISYGATKPTDLVKSIYQHMVKASKSSKEE
jgi:hypothetical protein